MILIHNQHVHEPAMNLAVEEYCFHHLDQTRDYLLLYINAPAVVIGRHQNALAEVNNAYIRRHALPVLRRISGGGAVYHDLGNLNFSFITHFDQDKLQKFKQLTRPILSTLRRMGLPATVNERVNFFVDADKISGNAQYTDTRRLMSHGTLLFDADLTALAQALSPDHRCLTTKGVPSVRRPVTNISDHLDQPIGVEAFIQQLLRAVAQTHGRLSQYNLTSKDWQRIEQLYAHKYTAWQWNWGRSPACILQRTYQAGDTRIELRLEIKNGLIAAIEPTNGLRSKALYRTLLQPLMGKPYDAQQVEHLLNPQPAPLLPRPVPSQDHTNSQAFLPRS